MFKKANLIIFLIPLFIACSSEPETKIPGEPITISLRKSNMPPSVKLSEMIGSIRLVALETKPGCYFGRVMQIDQIKDKIFIMDYDRKQGILVFDKYGKHLYNIGNPGKGPGEYTTLVGFSFSIDHKHIYLAAADQKKVSKYTLDGQLIGDIKFKDFYNDIQFLGDQDYVMVNRKNHYFRLGNLDTGEFIDTIKWSTGLMSLGSRLLYRSSEGHYLYSAPYLDTVFSISQDAVYPKYCFDFGPNTCTASEQMNFMKNNSYPYPPGKLFLEEPFLEIGDIFYFSITRELKPGRYGKVSVGLNNITNELFQINEDDVLFSRTYSALCTTYQSELVSVLNPAYAIDKVDQILNNDEFDYPDGFKDKIKQMDIEDNPLLIFFTFR